MSLIGRFVDGMDDCFGIGAQSALKSPAETEFREAKWPDYTGRPRIGSRL